MSFSFGRRASGNELKVRRRTNVPGTYQWIVSPDHLVLTVLEVAIAEAQLKFVRNLQPIGIYPDSSVGIVSDEAIAWWRTASNKDSCQTAKALARRCATIGKGGRRHDDGSNYGRLERLLMNSIIVRLNGGPTFASNSNKVIAVD